MGQTNQHFSEDLLGVTIFFKPLVKIEAASEWERLHGTAVHRTSLAEDLGIVWRLSFGAWAVLTWKATQ